MIEVTSVSHAFERENEGPLHVLDDVSCAIKAGTFVSLLGPSGCGKTTLLRILDGLIRPAVGEVRIDSKNT